MARSLYRPLDEVLRACAIEMHVNRKLQEKWRASESAQNADSHFVRACTVETHVNISQKISEACAVEVDVNMSH